MPMLFIADNSALLSDTLASAFRSGADRIVLVPCTDPAMTDILSGLPKVTTLRLPSDYQDGKTVQLLCKLKIQPHKDGFRQLRLAIPLFAQDSEQSLSKEIYPAIAEQLNFVSSLTVERSIRYAIETAWKRKDLDVWAEYFPRCRKPPSNKRFIATLAERIK